MDTLTTFTTSFFIFVISYNFITWFYSEISMNVPSEIIETEHIVNGSDFIPCTFPIEKEVVTEDVVNALNVLPLSTEKVETKDVVNALNILPVEKETFTLKNSFDSERFMNLFNSLSEN